MEHYRQTSSPQFSCPQGWIALPTFSQLWESIPIKSCHLTRSSTAGMLSLEFMRLPAHFSVSFLVETKSRALCIFISPLAFSQPLSYFTPEELLRWVGPIVTIAILKGGSSCIPEGSSVLFKAAELVQDKISLKIRFPDSQNFISAPLTLDQKQMSLVVLSSGS